eukprot:gene18860-19184_t
MIPGTFPHEVVSAFFVNEPASECINTSEGLHPSVLEGLFDMSAVLPKLTLTQVQTNPAAGTHPVPGSLVTYEITVDTDSTATAEATNAVLSLTLGSNLTLSGTPTVSDPTSGHTETVATTGTGFTVTFNQDIKKADGPVKITYTAQVAAGATDGATVAPKADITYQNASPDEIIYATANNTAGSATGNPFFYQYDATTNTISQFGTPTNPQDSLAFLGNGDVVTTFKPYNSLPGGIGLYNLTTGQSTLLVSSNIQFDLAVSLDSTKVYYNDVAANGQPTLEVYDLTTKTNSTVWTSTNGFGYTGLTFVPDGTATGKLFAAYGNDPNGNATSGAGKVVEINPANGAIINQAAANNGSNLDALRYDPFTHKLFVGNHSGGSNNIYQIDPTTLATDRTFTVGGTTVDGVTANGAIDGLSADGLGRLFVTSVNNAITVLDVDPASPTYGRQLHAVSTPAVDDTVPVSNHDNFNTSVTTSNTITVPGSLSGKVFVDDNADGKIDGTPTDTGLGGVTVQLLDSSGNAIAGKTTVTAADGTYSFTNLTPGNYGVQVTKPAGDLFSPKQGSISTVNSIVDTTTGKSAIVAVAAGANTPNLNAGVYLPASLSGTVFTDQNDNGVKEAGDAPLAGQTVQLLDSTGTAISGKTATTDASGNYSFTNLTPGTYSVKVTPASGNSFSPVGTAVSPAVDSIVDSSGQTAPVTLGSGDSVGGQNAGEYKPGSLSGHVFFDNNGNGVQDSGDNNLSGISVSLLDSTGALTGKTATTDSSGFYQFTGLTPGQYKVQVTAPSGDTFSPKGTNADPKLDSVVGTNGVSPLETVVSGTETPNVNAAVETAVAILPKLDVAIAHNAANNCDGGPGTVNNFSITLSPDAISTDDASNVKVALTIPAGLTYDGDAAVNDPNGGVWTISANPAGNGFTATLAGNYAMGAQPVSFTFTATTAAGVTAGQAIKPVVNVTYENATKDQFVYATSNVAATDASGNYGFLYQYDVTTGQLSTFGHLGNKQDSFVFDGKGNLIYTGQDSGNGTYGLSSYNINDGTSKVLVPGKGVYDLAITSDNKTVYYNDVSNGHKALYKYDLTTNTNSLVFENTGTSGFAGLAIIPGSGGSPDRLFAAYGDKAFGYASNGLGSVVEINPATGATIDQSLKLGNTIDGLLYDSYSGHLFASSSSSSANPDLWELNPSDLSVVKTYEIDLANGLDGLSSDGQGNIFIADYHKSIVKLDLTDGSVTAVASTPTIDDTIPVTQAVVFNSSDSVDTVVCAGTLSGHVFTDQNGDGIQQSGDTVLSGVTVQLLDASGNVIPGVTAVTDASGAYSFGNLNPGQKYSVQFTAPSGDVFSKQQAATSPIDSIVNPATGKTAPVTIVSEKDVPDQNAGVYKPASLSGTVFTDVNADGVKESADTPLAGQTVQLLDGSGTPISGKTTTTDASGNYSFTNLAPGSYSVKVTPAAGNTFSPVGTAASPAVDSIVDSTGKTAPVTLKSGDSVGGQNAGEYGRGSLSGKVFTDANADGKIDGTPTDSGLGGAVTNAVDSIVDPANGKTAPVAVISGTDTPNQNAGVYAPVSLSGTVFTDLNDNGVKNPLDTPVPGVEVDLYKDGVKTALATTTDASGNYSFTNLTPGTYSVQVVKPAADTFSPVGTDPAPAVDSIVDSSGKTAQHTLNSGDNLGGQNAGLFLPQPKLTITKTESISTGQAGDVLTYTVTVAEAAGNTVPAFNVSIADLLAVGETLVKGTETVKGGSGGPDTIVESGTGFTVTAPQLLSSDKPIVVTYQAKLADSVFNNDAITNVAHLGYDSAPAGGLHYTDQDQQTLTTHLVDQFSKSLVTTSQGGGNLAIPGETITFELDATLGKGTQHLVLTDSLPTGLTAISATVTAEGQVITSVPLNTTISPTGNSFTGDFGIVTTPGNSTDAVIKVLVTAKVDTTVPSGTTLTNTATLTSTTPAGAPQDKITSTASVSVVNPGKITGMVFLDGQCDGIFHAGDAGVAGVTVRLLDKAGKPTGVTTTTDSYGKYTFDRLIPGQYEVQIVAPQGTDYSDEKNAGTNPLLDSDVDPTTGITDVFTVGAGQTVAGINAGLEFNGAFGGSSPNDIGNGMFASNSGGNTILGHGGNTVLLGGNGGDIVVLDGKGVASAVEILGSGNEIVTSCGPLQAQTLTSGTGYIFAGNGGSSTLNGSVGDAYLMGGNGNDLIFAGSGHNVLIGGGGTGKVTT